MSTAEELTTGFADRLVEVDLETGGTRAWSAPGCWPGKPVPVAAPGADPDGEAVVLSLVLDARAQRSFLLVLDAETFTQRARALVPHVVPLASTGTSSPRWPGAADAQTRGGGDVLGSTRPRGRAGRHC